MLFLEAKTRPAWRALLLTRINGALRVRDTEQELSCHIRAVESGSLNLDGEEAAGSVCLVSSSECEAVVRT